MRAVGQKGLGDGGDMDWLIYDMNEELIDEIAPPLVTCSLTVRHHVDPIAMHDGLEAVSNRDTRPVHVGGLGAVRVYTRVQVRHTHDG